MVKMGEACKCKEFGDVPWWTRDVLIQCGRARLNVWCVLMHCSHSTCVYIQWDVHQLLLHYPMTKQIRMHQMSI